MKFVWERQPRSKKAKQAAEAPKSRPERPPVFERFTARVVNVDMGQRHAEVEVYGESGISKGFTTIEYSDAPLLPGYTLTFQPSGVRCTGERRAVLTGTIVAHEARIPIPAVVPAPAATIETPPAKEVVIDDEPDVQETDDAAMSEALRETFKDIADARVPDTLEGLDSLAEAAPQIAKWERIVGTIRISDDGERTFKLRNGTVMSADDVPEIQGIFMSDGTVLALERSDKSAWDVLENLGQAGELETERAALAYEIGADRIFPKDVEAEANELQEQGAKLIEQEVERGVVSLEGNWQSRYRHGENRIDFRDADTMTIDPVNAKDFDDAISYRTLPDGTVEVGVHIADVTHFVRPGSAIDKEAWRRQFTAYLEGGAMPMLPPVLADDLCSLVPGQDRLAFSTVFRFGKDGKQTGEPWHGKTIIRSKKRFTYDEADQLRSKRNVRSAEAKRLKHAITAITKIGRRFRAEREQRGAITLIGKQEPEITYDADGSIASIRPKAGNEMHKVIEDWMLMANEAMASSIVRNHEESGSTLPLFLRIHTPPSLPDLLEAATDLGAKQLASLIQKRIESGETGEVSDGTGGTIPIENYVVRRMLRSAKLSPERLRNIWNGATERNETPAQTRAYIAEREKEAEAHVLAIVRRLFKKAEYATEVRAHFGLGKTPYTQGTSPIRRYADIRVHQIMDAGLHEGVSAINEASLSNLEETAGQANRREKVVSGAEDRSMRMRGAALLEEKIGKTATIRLEQARFFGDTLKSVRVRVPLPRGGYPLTFTVKPDAFAGLPQGYREIDALRGKDIEARLTGVDVAAGAISLEYQGT